MCVEVRRRSERLLSSVGYIDKDCRDNALLTSWVCDCGGHFGQPAFWGREFLLRVLPSPTREWNPPIRPPIKSLFRAPILFFRRVRRLLRSRRDATDKAFVFLQSTVPSAGDRLVPSPADCLTSWTKQCGNNLSPRKCAQTPTPIPPCPGACLRSGS